MTLCHIILSINTKHISKEWKDWFILTQTDVQKKGAFGGTPLFWATVW